MTSATGSTFGANHHTTSQNADNASTRSGFQRAASTGSVHSSVNLDEADSVHSERPPAPTPAESLKVPPRKSFLSHVSAVLAPKKIPVPTFTDFADLAAEFATLFKSQVMYSGNNQNYQHATDPTLASSFRSRIANNLKHRNTIHYIVDCAARGKSVKDIVGQFKEQNTEAKKTPGEQLPFPEEVLPFVDIALKSIFLQLPTADRLKNAKEEIQNNKDYSEAYKFIASQWTNTLHSVVSLGLRITNFCFRNFGVGATLNFGSLFVPRILKEIINALVFQGAKKTSAATSRFPSTEININDIGRLLSTVLSATHQSENGYKKLSDNCFLRDDGQVFSESNKCRGVIEKSGDHYCIVKSADTHPDYQKRERLLSKEEVEAYKDFQKTLASQARSVLSDADNIALFEKVFIVSGGFRTHLQKSLDPWLKLIGMDEQQLNGFFGHIEKTFAFEPLEKVLEGTLLHLTADQKIGFVRSAYVKDEFLADMAQQINHTLYHLDQHFESFKNSYLPPEAVGDAVNGKLDLIQESLSKLCNLESPLRKETPTEAVPTETTPTKNVNEKDVVVAHSANKTLQYQVVQYALSALSSLKPVQTAEPKEKPELANDLWRFAAALMHATDCTVDIEEGLYKGWQLLEDDTVINSDGDIFEKPKDITDKSGKKDAAAELYFSNAEPLRESKIASRRQEILKAFKENIHFFSEIFTSADPSKFFDDLLSKSLLPSELQTLVKENTNFIFEFNKTEKTEESPRQKLIGLMRSLLQIATKNGGGKEQTLQELIGLMPDTELDRIANLFTATLKNFNPNKIEYFETFKEELTSSLARSERVSALAQVAEVLTEQYFTAIPINKKRRMASAILQSGKPKLENEDKHYLAKDSKKAFILAMTNNGGIGFQKAMQLFGDSVSDPVMRGALDEMKDEVDPVDIKDWAVNKCAAELMEINKRSWGSAKIGDQYAQYTLVNESFKEKPLKAATVGQVHTARVNITYHIRSATPLTEVAENTENTKKTIVQTGDAEVVVEGMTKMNMPVVIKLLRENAKRDVSAEMNALMSLPGVKDSASVRGTLEGVKEGILEEVKFTIEKKNGDLLEKIYTGEVSTSSGQKLTMKTAKVFAATEEMLIEEFIKGGSFKDLWKSKDKKDIKDKDGKDRPVENKDNSVSGMAPKEELVPYSERPEKEQLEFLEQWRLSVGLLARNWVSGLVNGASCDGASSLPGGMGVIDSDRHAGNWMYSSETHTVSVFDYGTITKLDEGQRAAMIELTAAIFAQNATGVINNLKKLMMPAHLPEEEAVAVPIVADAANANTDAVVDAAALLEEKRADLMSDIAKAIKPRENKEQQEDFLKHLKDVGFINPKTQLADLYQIFPKEQNKDYSVSLSRLLHQSDNVGAVNSILRTLVEYRKSSLLSIEMKSGIEKFITSSIGKTPMEMMRYIGAHPELGLPAAVNEFMPTPEEEKELAKTDPDHFRPGVIKEEDLVSILELAKTDALEACKQLCSIFDHYKTRFYAQPEVEDDTRKKIEEYLKVDNGHRLYSLFTSNGSLMSQWFPASLSDKNDDLYFIRTIQKIANVLTKYDISAPKSIVQLNRGTSFMRNHVHKNGGYLDAVDQFLKAHKEKLLKNSDNRVLGSATKLMPQVEAEFKAMEAKLKDISLGDNFLAALIPQAMPVVRGVVRQLAEPSISRVNSAARYASGETFKMFSNMANITSKVMGVSPRTVGITAGAATAAVASAATAYMYYG